MAEELPEKKTIKKLDNHALLEEFEFAVCYMENATSKDMLRRWRSRYWACRRNLLKRMEGSKC